MSLIAVGEENRCNCVRVAMGWRMARFCDRENLRIAVAGIPPFHGFIDAWMVLNVFFFLGWYDYERHCACRCVFS